MSCKDCEARRAMLRDAVLQSKIKEALGHAVKGVAEIVGLKPKTGEVERDKRKTSKSNPGESGNPAREGNVNQEQS